MSLIDLMALVKFLQASIIKDLEGRVHQLMSEADKNMKAKQALEKSKMELESKLERSTQDLQDVRERFYFSRCLQLSRRILQLISRNQDLKNIIFVQ
jgi:hypothetical protein